MEMLSGSYTDSRIDIESTGDILVAQLTGHFTVNVPDFRIYMFSLKNTICNNIQGRHKQYIQVDIGFNNMFHFGLWEHIFIEVRRVTFLPASPPAPERCISITCIKTCSWQSNMNTCS